MRPELQQFLDSCGAPLVSFIVGLFFPQVRLTDLVNLFRWRNG